MRTPLAFAAVFLFCTLLMRGPVTSIGPMAQDIREMYGVSYAAYGLLTAIPIAAFGLFSFAGPALAERFGLLKAIWLAVALLTVGAAMRLTTSWTALLAATMVVGAGIALMNVYMTVAVKTLWPENLGTMMGLYTGVIGLSGAVGGLTSVPLMRAAGGVWGTMLFWCAAGVLGFVLWAFGRPSAEAAALERQRRQESILEEQPASAGGPAPHRCADRALSTLSAMAREPLAWALTGVMGVQSLLIYTVSAWMPPYWHSTGMDAAATGLWLFIYLVSGLPASVFTARFMAWCREEFRAEAVLTAAYLAGLALWFWGSDSVAALFAGSVLAGAAQGAMLSVAFLLMSRKTKTGAQMLAVNSLAQGAGYLFAGLGPLIFGALYTSTQSWDAPFVFTAVMIAAWGTAGRFASRRASF